MREAISNPSASPGRNPQIVWTGTILVIIGRSLPIVVGEWFAAFYACVANPASNAGPSPSTLEVYLALTVTGVALAVVGVTVGPVRGTVEPRRAMILGL